MSSSLTRKIALIVGTSRLRGNGAGISAWLSSVVQSQLSAATSPSGEAEPLQLVVIDSTTPPFPLGPILEDSYIPAQVKDPENYSTQPVRDWSTFVSSCSGFIFLFPEYNGGYPGSLKDALDHLYHEWKGKPALVVTYASRGGGRATTQFQQILENLKFTVAERSVKITLPGEFVWGESRVTSSTDFLSQYRVPVEQATEDFVKLIHSRD